MRDLKSRGVDRVSGLVLIDSEDLTWAFFAEISWDVVRVLAARILPFTTHLGSSLN